MLIIPAIDLKDGQCIRLRQGLAGTESVYSNEPVAVARRWESEGAELIHLVDLDGAFTGHPKNRELVTEIIKSVEIPVQVSGGIRSHEDIEYYTNSGASRLVLGTKAVSDPKFLEKALYSFPDRISVGLDTRDGMVMVKGWTEATTLSAADLATTLNGLKILSFIFTDVRQDGMLRGPNLTAIRDLANVSTIPVIASGGISSLEDIRALLRLEPLGVKGLIIGKALYTGAVSLGEATALIKRENRAN